MKSIFNFLLIFSLVALINISCAIDDDVSGILAGSSCLIPGELECSGDREQILRCADNMGVLVWEVQRSCNTNFGEYCRLVNGSPSCNDSPGDTGDTGNTGNTGDTGNTGNTGNTGDTGDTGNTGNTGDNGEVIDNRSPDCVSIADCIKACTDNPCATACFEAGTEKGKAEYQAYEACANSSGHTTFLDIYEACTTEAEVCGFAGDPNYSIPYGNANIDGTFNYIITTEESITTAMVLQSPFVTGTVGSISIVDQTHSSNVFSYAAYSPPDAPNPARLLVFQEYNTVALANPVSYIIADPTKVSVGTNSIGLTGTDTLQLFVVEVDSEGNIVCRHGFGVGTVNVSAINTSAGDAGSFAVAGSNIKIYSMAAAPIYGGDVTVNESDACPPN